MPLACDIVLIEESSGEVNGRLEKLREALESKRLRINRGINRIFSLILEKINTEQLGKCTL